jgi:FKBP-type peptidyl-prolyl cis-trans isomerase
MNSLKAGFYAVLAIHLLVLSLTASPLAAYAEQPTANAGASKGMTKTWTGLQYQDHVVGTGAVAKHGKTVSVKYTGTLYPSGQEFDSSDRHGGDPILFKLGAGRVIEGWDEGITGMQVGGKRTLIIPPDLAYGDSGIAGVIPPGATLKFDVELVDVK